MLKIEIAVSVHRWPLILVDYCGSILFEYLGYTDQ